MAVRALSDLFVQVSIMTRDVGKKDLGVGDCWRTLWMRMLA